MPPRGESTSAQMAIDVTEAADAALDQPDDAATTTPLRMKKGPVLTAAESESQAKAGV